jgi:hypothetical protein
MAAKLYDCRDTAKNFFGDKYNDRIKPFKDLIQVVMKANNIEEIPALLKISDTEVYNQAGMNQLLFMAATVELIESPEPEK